MAVSTITLLWETVFHFYRRPFMTAFFVSLLDYENAWGGGGPTKTKHQQKNIKRRKKKITMSLREETRNPSYDLSCEPCCPFPYHSSICCNLWILCLILDYNWFNRTCVFICSKSDRIVSVPIQTIRIN